MGAENLEDYRIIKLDRDMLAKHLRNVSDDRRARSLTGIRKTSADASRAALIAVLTEGIHDAGGHRGSSAGTV